MRRMRARYSTNRNPYLFSTCAKANCGLEATSDATGIQTSCSSGARFAMAGSAANAMLAAVVCKAARRVVSAANGSCGGVVGGFALGGFACFVSGCCLVLGSCKAVHAATASVHRSIGLRLLFVQKIDAS